MHEAVERMIQRRSSQACRSILRAKDRVGEMADSEYLDAEGAQILQRLLDELRNIVLDEVNEFAGLCTDLLEAVGRDDVAVNGLWLDKIDEIHQAVTQPAEDRGLVSRMS